MKEPITIRTKIKQGSRQRTILEHPHQEIKESIPLGPAGLLTHKTTPQDRGSKQINLIHRNTYKETTKMGRQRSNPQTK